MDGITIFGIVFGGVVAAAIFGMAIAAIAHFDIDDIQNYWVGRTMEDDRQERIADFLNRAQVKGSGVEDLDNLALYFDYWLDLAKRGIKIPAEISFRGKELVEAVGRELNLWKDHDFKIVYRAALDMKNQRPPYTTYGAFGNSTTHRDTLDMLDAVETRWAMRSLLERFGCAYRL